MFYSPRKGSIANNLKKNSPFRFLTGGVFLLGMLWGCASLPPIEEDPQAVIEMLPSTGEMIVSVEAKESRNLFGGLLSSMVNDESSLDQIYNFLDSSDRIYVTLDGEGNFYLLLSGDFDTFTYNLGLTFSSKWKKNRETDSWENQEGISLKFYSNQLLAVTTGDIGQFGSNQLVLSPDIYDLLLNGAFGLVLPEPGGDLLGGIGGAMIPLDYILLSGQTETETSYALSLVLRAESEQDARPLTAIVRLMIFGAARLNLPPVLTRVLDDQLEISRNQADIIMDNISVSVQEIPELLALVNIGGEE